MLDAVERALPADVAIFAAAVADWRVANAGEQKLKKQPGKSTPELPLVENPDILATIAKTKISAAETGDRLCRRNRECRRECQGETRQERLRLDSRQRRLTAVRRHGRRSQHDHACPSFGDRNLAAAEQGRGSISAVARIRRHSVEKSIVSGIDIRFMRLAHGKDLPLPSYQSAQPAGLDLLAAVPADRPRHHRARRPRPRADRIAIALPEGYEAQVRPRSGPRCPAWSHRPQFARHDRRGLSRRDPGPAGQSRQRIGCRSPRHADCPNGDRASCTRTY